MKAHTYGEFLIEAKKIHGDKYMYLELFNYVNNKIKIPYECPIHGKKETTWKNHINVKSGCNECGFVISAEKKKKNNTEDFVTISKKQFGETAFIYSNKIIYKKGVANFYLNCRVCKNEFSTTHQNHINNKKGCPICGKKNGGKKNRLSENEVLELINPIISSKNIHLENFKYKRTKDKFIANCPIHGNFPTTYNLIKYNHGCKACGTLKTANSLKLKVDDILRRIKQVHSDTYEIKNTLQLEILKNNTSKIEVICKTHGVFNPVLKSFLNGSGCRKCGRDVCAKKLSNGYDVFVEKAMIKHEGKGYKYLKEATYINNKTEIKVICDIHGEFFTSYRKHILRGQGCDKCKQKYSYAEMLLMKYFKENAIEFEYEKKVDKLLKRNFIEFDFYLPQYDLYIEYQGGDHHRARDKKHETLVRRINIDFKKRKYAYENKMNFIALEEYHLKDLSKVFEVLLNFKKN